MKNLYTIAALVLGIIVLPVAALAADIGVQVSEESFCITGLGSVGGILVGALGAVVVIASALANAISKDSFIGKIIHYLAINVTVDKVKK